MEDILQVLKEQLFLKKLKQIDQNVQTLVKNGYIPLAIVGRDNEGRVLVYVKGSNTKQVRESLLKLECIKNWGVEILVKNIDPQNEAASYFPIDHSVM